MYEHTHVDQQHLPDIFFFNDTATTEIYTLSLHDALPIYAEPARQSTRLRPVRRRKTSSRDDLRTRDVSGRRPREATCSDRKSTRLNSSHANISYAVFCLKKK